MPDINKVSLLYRASRDGWDSKDFHNYCDDRGRTLSLYRSSKGYLSAGYASVVWTSGPKFGGNLVEDKQAFVFTLTNQMKVFKPRRPDNAVYHCIFSGPCFDAALAVHNKMDDYNQGCCHTIDSRLDKAKYRISTDDDENSILTGDGAKNNNDQLFTCTDLEVFLIE